MLQKRNQPARQVLVQQELRKVFQYFSVAHATGQHGKNVIHSNAQAADTRSATALSRLQRNAIHRALQVDPVSGSLRLNERILPNQCPLANSAAFPPAAVVFTVMVCSAQKRYR